MQFGLPFAVNTIVVPDSREQTHASCQWMREPNTECSQNDCFRILPTAINFFDTFISMIYVVVSFTTFLSAHAEWVNIA